LAVEPHRPHYSLRQRKDARSASRVSLTGVHAHDHDHPMEGDRKLLIAALALIAALMVGEIVTGMVAGSLAP